MNLPKLVTFSGGNTIEFIYDAAGMKLKKATNTGVNKNYVAGIEYAGANLEAIYHPEGRLTPNGTAFYYEYALKDHLGNSRIMFRANGGTAQVLQENHYYPFGMEMEGTWAAQVGTENGYQYNGKELNDDFGLNWYAYGARFYDAAIGRFTGIDPLADTFPHLSPFNYASNDPIKNIDLYGLQGVQATGGNFINNAWRQAQKTVVDFYTQKALPLYYKTVATIGLTVVSAEAPTIVGVGAYGTKFGIGALSETISQTINISVSTGGLPKLEDFDIADISIAGAFSALGGSGGSNSQILNSVFSSSLSQGLIDMNLDINEAQLNIAIPLKGKTLEKTAFDVTSNTIGGVSGLAGSNLKANTITNSIIDGGIKGSLLRGVASSESLPSKTLNPLAIKIKPLFDVRN